MISRELAVAARRELAARELIRRRIWGYGITCEERDGQIVKVYYGNHPQAGQIVPEAEDA